MGQQIKYIYLFEKGITMPLCACDGENYIDFFTGEVITNKKILNFIKLGKKTGLISAYDLRILIYKIVNHDKIVGYKYVINDAINFLDEKKKLLSTSKIYFYLEKIKKGDFKEEILWSDVN